MAVTDGGSFSAAAACVTAAAAGTFRIPGGADAKAASSTTASSGRGGGSSLAPTAAAAPGSAAGAGGDVFHDAPDMDPTSSSIQRQQNQRPEESAEERPVLVGGAPVPSNEHMHFLGERRGGRVGGRGGRRGRGGRDSGMDAGPGCGAGLPWFVWGLCIVRLSCDCDLRGMRRAAWAACEARLRRSTRAGYGTGNHMRHRPFLPQGPPLFPLLRAFLSPPTLQPQPPVWFAPAPPLPSSFHPSRDLHPCPPPPPPSSPPLPRSRPAGLPGRAAALHVALAQLLRAHAARGLGGRTHRLGLQQPGGPWGGWGTG